MTTSASVTEPAAHAAGSTRPLIGEPGALVDLEPRIGRRTVGGYRTSNTVDLAIVNGITVGAVSLKGALHHEFGTVRQDSYGLATDARDRYIVVAVADGVSEAKLSHLAADLACQTATSFIVDTLDSEASVGSLDWEKIVMEIRLAIRRRSASSFPEGAEDATDEQLDRAIAKQVMSTTLDVVVVDTAAQPVEFVSAKLAGDGSTYILAPAEGMWQQLQVGKTSDSADAVITTAVQALPLDPGPATVVSGQLTPGSALIVCTDGIGDPLGDAKGELGAFLASALATPVHAGELLRVFDFVQVGATDDRTAVIVWPPSS